MQKGTELNSLKNIRDVSCIKVHMSKKKGKWKTLIFGHIPTFTSSRKGQCSGFLGAAADGTWLVVPAV